MKKLLHLSIKFHQNSSHGSKVTLSQTDKLSTFSSLQLLIDGHIQACVLQQMQDDRSHKRIQPGELILHSI